MMSLFGAMAQAQQQAMMNAATNAMNPDKSSQPAFGGDMLGAFFGSSEITRAVAAQAAAVSESGGRSSSRCCRQWPRCLPRA